MTPPLKNLGGHGRCRALSGALVAITGQNRLALSSRDTATTPPRNPRFLRHRHDTAQQRLNRVFPLRGRARGDTYTSRAREGDPNRKGHDDR